MFLLESLLHTPLSKENPHTCLITHVSAAAQHLFARHLLKPLMTMYHP